MVSFLSGTRLTDVKEVKAFLDASGAGQLVLVCCVEEGWILRSLGENRQGIICP